MISKPEYICDSFIKLYRPWLQGPRFYIKVTRSRYRKQASQRNYVSG